MDKDEGSAKIVKSVVNLGRDLGLDVVAEGVENAGLAKLLLEAQCHYGQGFGYAQALPAQEAEVYLNESLADGIAALLRDLSENPARRMQMAQAARALAKVDAAERIADIILEEAV